MTYYDFYCPHCKTHLEHTTSWSIKYASPFFACPHCGDYYYDKRKREAGIKGYPFHYKYFSLSWLLSVLLIPPIQTYFDTKNTEYLFVAIVMACLLIPFMVWRSYRVYHKQRDELNEEMKESLERLSNDNYVNALRKAGCRIPKDFSARERLAAFEAELAKQAEREREAAERRIKPPKDPEKVLSGRKIKNGILLAVSCTATVLFAFISLIGFLSMKDGNSSDSLPVFLFVLGLTALSLFLFIRAFRKRMQLCRSEFQP